MNIEIVFEEGLTAKSDCGVAKVQRELVERERGLTVPDTTTLS